MKSPIDFKDFAANPVTGLLFFCLIAIDILHEGEYWLHTHRKKTLDDSMELIEQYANQKVIEELEIIAKEINSFTATNRIEKRLLNKIKELKQ